MTSLAANSEINGKFRLERILGQGGMGAVWKAEQIGIGRNVAVKVIAAERGSEHLRARFEREALALGRLNHPNCVTLIDYGKIQDSDTLYIALEFIEGSTLEERMQRPISVGLAIEIVRQIALALEHSHGKGVLHRDLKPANIMLVDHGAEGLVVKVLDFGIARLTEGKNLETLTKVGQIFGTPDYMSPEQASGDSKIAVPSDIYSLGVILYEMLAGRNPFSAATPLQSIMNHLRMEPPTIPNLPEQLSSVVMKMIRKAPEERFGSARELIEMLDAVSGRVVSNPTVPLISVDLQETLDAPALTTPMLDETAVDVVVQQTTRLMQPANPTLRSDPPPQIPTMVSAPHTPRLGIPMATPQEMAGSVLSGPSLDTTIQQPRKTASAPEQPLVATARERRPVAAHKPQRVATVEVAPKAIAAPTWDSTEFETRASQSSNKSPFWVAGALLLAVLLVLVVVAVTLSRDASTDQALAPAEVQEPEQTAKAQKVDVEAVVPPPEAKPKDAEQTATVADKKSSTTGSNSAKVPAEKPSVEDSPPPPPPPKKTKKRKKRRAKPVVDETIEKKYL